jgi:hypothetical protein
MARLDVQLRLNTGAINRMLYSSGGIVGRAIYRMGLEWVKEAKSRAPVKTGALKASIGILVWPGPRNSLEAGANINYAINVEKGVKGGTEILPKNGKVLRFPNKAGVIVYAPKVTQGAVKANPFLWDSLVAVVRRYR